MLGFFVFDLLQKREIIRKNHTKKLESITAFMNVFNVARSLNRRLIQLIQIVTILI